MESLFGLIEHGGTGKGSNYRRLMPADVLEEVEELWGTRMNAREPGRIVITPLPHYFMAETFGPALRFWNGCAHMVWCLCEPTYSPTDMSGLEHYYGEQLAKLHKLGAPVDQKMFVELITAEESLGPEEPIYRETQHIEGESGIIPEPQEFIGYGREGFERLRDVITKYRRAWGQKHLDAYLRTRAENSVRWAAQTYYRKTAERGGRPPTLQQFAGTAMGPTNRWFGGDISALYRAFGEKSPVSPKRVDRFL